MKGLMLVGISALTFSAMATAQEAAPADLIAELTQFCTEVAEDEGTKGMALNEFLLQCVNDELEAEGYAAVSSLN